MEEIEELWRSALRWEKELASILNDHPNSCSVDNAIFRLREAYANIIFVDCRIALERGVEGRIWGKHRKVIERYRGILSQFQETHGRKRPVEFRKLRNSYINFIKQATCFYRSLIQRLISHFGLAELAWVIRKFNLSVDFPTTGSPRYEAEIKRLVISSCHRTLVFLGDLSRYREVSQPENPKNWSPATCYYTLAKKLVPTLGSPHNQLAVIALNEGSSFSATYHLYRALTVAEPFPEAGDNLSVGFRKVLKATASLQVVRKEERVVREEERVVHELVALFIRFHAKCFTGKEFSDYEAMESEMLAQLALDLKERAMPNGMLIKFVLINISAQFYAAQVNKHSHSYFLRLNVATFTTLYRVFQPELRNHETEPISAAGRRMLPALRLYSTWLRINYPTLTGQLADPSLSMLIQQLWQTYANTLSLLGTAFPINHPPKLSYLLEEDDDTIGYLPFSQANGSTTHNWGDGSEGRAHPNDEMLARIFSLLEDGRSLCPEATPNLRIRRPSESAQSHLAIPDDKSEKSGGYNK